VAGFDFPIGVPRAYAGRAGLSSLHELLRHIGSLDPAGRFARFCDVATPAEEISLQRPFYPGRQGGTRHVHLTKALGVPDMNALRRRCERPHADRGAACPLFWTLGRNQVGKAALSGWQEVIAPALVAQAPAALWPFDGALHELIEKAPVTLVETYPAEFYGHLGVRFAKGKGNGKRSQGARRTKIPALHQWLQAHLVEIDNDARVALDDAFGHGDDGEDRFDSFIGACGMIDVLARRRPSGEPTDDPAVSRVEGWILGMNANASPARALGPRP